MSIYDFNVKTIDGEQIKLDEYKDKVLVIVNTASKCGFTPQYAELEKLYKKYKDKDFEILGFPCNQFAHQEPGSNTDVKSFCLINYGVTFPLFEKVDVRDANAHPLFNYLTEKAAYKGLNIDHPIGKGLFDFLKEKFPEFLIGDSIKWNFTKFLIDRSGNVSGRYEPTTEPAEMEMDIEKLL